MKVLHSSDVLIGMGFPGAPGRAERFRDYRLDALKSLVALAAREKVDAIILAGNTLADNRLSYPEIMAAVEALRTSSVPVYLLPGLTDPYVHDSPYRREDLFTAPVHILAEQTPIRIRGATLYPCPVRSRPDPEDSSSGQDPTEWIPLRQAEDEVRIGIACFPPQRGGGAYPWSTETLEARDLDYLALGGQTTSGQVPPAHWSGSPEATRYGESQGQACVVNLKGPHVPPRVRGLSTGRYTWLSKECQVKDLETLQAEIDRIKDPESTMLRLILRGRLPAPALELFEQRLAGWHRKFHHLELDNRLTLRPGAEDDYHHPLLRMMAQRLSEKACEPIQSTPADLPDESELARAAWVGRAVGRRAAWGFPC